jgi:hypothetical protein
LGWLLNELVLVRAIRYNSVQWVKKRTTMLPFLNEVALSQLLNGLARQIDSLLITKSKAGLGSILAGWEGATKTISG